MKNTVKAVLTSVLACVAVPVLAEWVEVVSLAEGKIFLDPTTIRRSGEMHRAWELISLRITNKEGARSYRRLEEFDCKEERQRNLQLAWFPVPMGIGKPDGQSENGGAWTYIAPGTPGALILKYVCAR